MIYRKRYPDRSLSVLANPFLEGCVQTQCLVQLVPLNRLFLTNPIGFVPSAKPCVPCDLWQVSRSYPGFIMAAHDKTLSKSNSEENSNIHPCLVRCRNAEQL